MASISTRGFRDSLNLALEVSTTIRTQLQPLLAAKAKPPKASPVLKPPQISHLCFILLTNSTPMSSFETFFEGWLVRQEHYLDELQSAQQRAHEARDVDLRELVSRVMLHYQQYYEEKSRIAQRDVFLVFSPTWFTSVERALLWIAGFKPGLAFRLVSDSVPDLSEDQRVRMTRLMKETRVEERMLNDKLAKIHESVAVPPLVDVARRYARFSEGEVTAAEEGDAAKRSLKSALEGVVANANMLRTTLATKLVEMLSGAQAVRFLVAVAQFQLKVRNWGLERDAAEKQRSGGGRRW